MSAIYPYKLTFADDAPAREASIKVTVEGKQFRVAPPSSKLLYTKKSWQMPHSVWTGEFDGKRRVFVSLPEEISKNSNTSTNVSGACIIDLDRRNRVKRITPAVKITSPHDKGLESLKRRLSIMQRLNGSRYFPKSEAMFEYNGKHGRTAAIFQKRAIGNLTQYITDKRMEGVSDEEKLRLFEKLVLGLMKFHKKGYLHKDIKPDNILLYKKQGRLSAKITDFDMACKRDDRKSRQQICGTMMWAPPEFIRSWVKNRLANTKQLCPTRFTPAFDVWCLGMSIYCLFYLKSPQIFSDAEKMGDALLDIEELRQKVQKHKPEPQKGGLIGWLESFFCSNTCVDPHQELDNAIKQFKVCKARWKASLSELPPPRKPIRSIEDILTSMIQEKPEKRASLEQVLQAIVKLRKKKTNPGNS